MGYQASTRLSRRFKRTALVHQHPSTGDTDGYSDDNRVHPSWHHFLTDPIRLTLVSGLYEAGSLTVPELAEWGYGDDRTLKRHLDAMVALGLIFKFRGEGDGCTPGRPAARFALDPRVRERLAPLFEILRDPVVP